MRISNILAMVSSWVACLTLCSACSTLTVDNSLGISSTTFFSNTSSVSTTASKPTERNPIPMDSKESLGLTDEMIKTSVLNEGNRARLKAVMEKAERGEPITIGFLGGSITDGSNVPQGKSYASLVRNWWLNTFPATEITYVNAGVGSTGSIIGVHRVDKDLLQKKPDFVVVEYAVNDGTDQETKEAYESLIRKILNAENQPALLLLFMCTNGGGGAQDMHASVGEHYDLPMISYRDACKLAVDNNLFPWTKFSTDTVHPNEFGYATCALFINTYLENVYNQLDTINDPLVVLPQPLTADIYRNTKVLTCMDFVPQSPGSFVPISQALPFAKNGWESKDGTEPFIFETEAKRITILYRRDKSIDRGSVLVTANEEPMCYLLGNYEQGWDSLPSVKQVYHSDVTQKVCIEITPDAEDLGSFVIAAIYIAY